MAHRNEIIKKCMGWLVQNIMKEDEKVSGWNRLEKFLKIRKIRRWTWYGN